MQKFLKGFRVFLEFDAEFAQERWRDVQLLHDLAGGRRHDPPRHLADVPVFCDGLDTARLLLEVLGRLRVALLHDARSAGPRLGLELFDGLAVRRGERAGLGPRLRFETAQRAVGQDVDEKAQLFVRTFVDARFGVGLGGGRKEVAVLDDAMAVAFAVKLRVTRLSGVCLFGVWSDDL